MKTLAQAYAEKLEKPRCWPQCLPEDHRDEPVQRGQTNWIRTSCSRCQAFIGYRPVETKQPPTAVKAK